MEILGAVINAGAPPSEMRRRLEAVVSEDWRRTVPAGELEAAAAELIDRGARIVIAGGGDGTVSTVGTVVLRAGATLGLCPLGTRNHFARDLAIPLEPEAWSELLRRRPRRRIDVGEVNGRTFLNNVAIGLYPRIVREREVRMRRHRWRKRAADLVAGIRALTRFSMVRCTIRAGGETTRRLTPMLFVGNNRYDGGWLAESRRPSLDAGVLWVCLVRASGRFQLIRAVWKTWRRRIDRIEDLDVFEVEEMQLEFKRKTVNVAIDGETVRLESPLVFRIRKQALEVMAP